MHTIEQQLTVSYRYPVIFTRSAFNGENAALRDVICRAGSGRNRMLVVVDSEVARLTPSLLGDIVRYAEAHSDALELAAPPVVVRGGEICKNEPLEVNQIHALIRGHRLCRHSFLVAIGGGALLDAVGYASATAHRGLRLVRMPTTVLSQNDAGIGVKNGINAFGRKNFVGTFAPPFGVICDFDFLSTLPRRDARSGIAEAVKVALIRDGAFFDELCRERQALSSLEGPALERMIVRCAELHLQHIAGSGDPFESGSARPLDFGHWSAHKLEELTHNGLRHGEAVAIGMAIDSLYSEAAGLLPRPDLQRILTLLRDLGYDLSHPSICCLDVVRSLEEFREHLGGQLSIPLLSGIGSMVEAHTINNALMKRCIDWLASLTVHHRTSHFEGEGNFAPVS